MKSSILYREESVLFRPTRMPHKAGGPCKAWVDGEEDGEEGGECGKTWSSQWYGKRGHQFCSSHRAAWQHWRNESGAGKDGDEQPSNLTEMSDLLGTRFCEPSVMEWPDRYNDIKKNALQYCVQGTYAVEGYAKGHDDTRWQTLEQLTRNCSREDFESLSAAYIKDLQKKFKNDAKKFKPAAELDE